MDLNVKAFRLVQGVIGEAPETNKLNKRTAARKGGILGGIARAKSMSPERRAEIARTANAARWRTQPPTRPK